MSLGRRKNKVVRRAGASHAPGKSILARGWRGQRGARSKMRVQRGGLTTGRAASRTAFRPALQTNLGEPDGNLLWYNRNPTKRT